MNGVQEVTGSNPVAPINTIDLNKTDMTNSDFSGSERRKFKRIKKHFILSYCAKNNPTQRYDVTQLKNISRGGMCFLATVDYPLNTEIAIELKTPYLADVIYLEGSVLESHKKISNMIYETRLTFKELSPIACSVVDKLEKLMEGEA